MIYTLWIFQYFFLEMWCGRIGERKEGKERRRGK